MESSIYIVGKKHWYRSGYVNGKKIITNIEVDDESKSMAVSTYENGNLLSCEIRMINNETSPGQHLEMDESKVSEYEENTMVFEWYQNVQNYFERINSDMALRDLTLGDGNCFYHAVLDQINLLRVSSPS